ncbi:peptidoglycan binding domain containing protein [Colletotrichum tofieldiae]|nr:peptidoglycan binding domain containing protein [Colletotrichum tofieldiae]GKT71285.1 peptidoglycan binding domain containing protein [Colletotrichum tofieldiae]GKT93794.1 peptidoglycan binding domain containing protein [Colletotrichum tofieldiae]
MPYRGPQKNPLIVLSDGSWSGRERGAYSNVYQLANLVWGGAGLPKDDEFAHLHPSGKAHYVNSVPVGIRGLNVQDIKHQSVDAYEYLVRGYTPQETEIWMFGVSKGAYIVRSVAGMINNCGIVKPVYSSSGDVDEEKTHELCQEVYRIYQCPSEPNAPKSEKSRDFRRKNSWDLIGDGDVIEPPVRFMGIFDTVGNHGIPEFAGSLGIDWPKFYDHNVSSVVSEVYHAVSLHDRLYAFQPCLISRDTEYGPSYGITERWFPGTHYDICRQQFKFTRGILPQSLEGVLPAWSWTSKAIKPNEVLADLVFKWMLECIDTHDPSGFVIPKGSVYRELDRLKGSISKGQNTGDGDVYNRILQFAPFGRYLDMALSMAFGKWQNTQLYQLVFACRPRSVPDFNASVYNYRGPDPNLDGNIIQKLANLPSSSTPAEKQADTRYPSTSYDGWLLRS